jgi:hypothetical protein
MWVRRPSFATHSCRSANASFRSGIGGAGHTMDEGQRAETGHDSHLGLRARQVRRP